MGLSSCYQAVDGGWDSQEQLFAVVKATGEPFLASLKLARILLAPVWTLDNLLAPILYAMDLMQENATEHRLSEVK
jgi:hypothetical protein